MGELSRGLLKVLVLALVTGVTFQSKAALQCSSLFADESSTRGIASDKVGSESSSNELKIGTYNMLNLFLQGATNAAKPTKKGKPGSQKPRWAVEQIANILKSENYDIFVAQEIESIGTAKRFNEEFLGNQYDVYSTTTKDVRGLFVVFFVKKSLPFTYKVESHVEETWFDPVKNEESLVYERDLPTLHIYKNAEDKVPMLTMLGVHFKSKRHRSGGGDGAKDFESNILREAQANRATKIIQKYQIEFGYDHPILMAGDFNSNHNFAPEYVGFLRHAKLSDTIGLKEEIQRYSDRTTHSYFGGAKPKHNQLDGILITPSLVGFLKESYVVKYKNADGSEKEIPKTGGDRKDAPSDHRPITAIFSIEGLQK